ncbi:MAG: hypothetical protein C0604_00155 [Clostridiales bacterium]|nr:MAG: hypothetical protein C0604_00155 [Clostridiales bacterium]
MAFLPDEDWIFGCELLMLFYCFCLARKPEIIKLVSHRAKAKDDFLRLSLIQNREELWIVQCLSIQGLIGLREESVKSRCQEK